MSPSKPAPTFSFPALALVFLSPSLGGLLFGYDIGATSFAASMLYGAPSSEAAAGNSAGDDPWWAAPSPNPAFEEGLVVSSVSLGALLGSLLAFRLADSVGRRAELRIASLLYLCGAALDVLSGTALGGTPPRWPGVACLVLGRTAYGIGVGFAMHGAPTYMAEMTPPSVRGAVVTAKEAFIVLGMILGYGAGYAVAGGEDDGGDRWYVPYGCSALIAASMLVSTFAIPRSARWLLLRGEAEEALRSLRFLYGDDGAEAREEFENIRYQLEEQRSGGDGSSEARSVFSREMKRALLAGIGLVVFQQITGQPSVMTYVTIIFKEAGLGGESSVLVAVFMFFSTLTTVATVDRFGRKTLLYAGCSMMLVALVVLTVAFHGYDLALDGVGNRGSLNARSLTILLSMFLYIGGYEVGFGPITWLVLSEIFPLDVRGQAVAFGVQVNFALNFLVQLVVPIIQDTFGLSNTFALFGLLTASSLVFVRAFVVETKGLSLEEVESVLQKDVTRQVETIEATENDLLLSNLT